MQTVEGHHRAPTEALLKPYFAETLGAAYPLYLNIYESIRKKVRPPNFTEILLWSILMFEEKKVILRYIKVPMYFCYARILLQNYI